MGTIVEFIESESFFPFLILLFVALVFIFASILTSSKRKRIINERKNVKIDESAQVQLVSEHGHINQFATMEEENDILEVETGSNEVNLFVESVDVDEIDQNTLEENDSIIYDFEPIIPINKMNFSKEEVEVTPYIENKKDENISLTEVYQEDNDNDKININHEEVLPNEANEVEVIKDDVLADDNDTNDEDNAFTIRPDDNKEINENIVVEEKEEYPDKTEILEFPDFDSINQDTGIEDEIIDEANKYIESIMNR